MVTEGGDAAFCRILQYDCNTERKGACNSNRPGMVPAANGVHVMTDTTNTATALGLISFHIAKLNETRDIDWEMLPLVTQRFYARNGMKQKYADEHASIKRDGYATDEAWLAAVTAAMDKWEARAAAGDVPGERSSDPTAAKDRKLVAGLKALTPEERKAIEDVMFAKLEQMAAEKAAAAARAGTPAEPASDPVEPVTEPAPTPTLASTKRGRKAA